MSLQPIQRKSLAREVAESLQYSIERGVFAIEEQLPPEPELMKKFGVGRSTIREAIKYLAQSGFVKVQQGLGTFVISHTGTGALDTTIERAAFADIFEVRQLLEMKIVEKAVLNRTIAQVNKMGRLLKKRHTFALSGQKEACIEADIDFHIAVAESCGNPILFELYKTMSAHVAKFFNSVYTDTASFIASQTTHEELLLQIKERNTAKAMKAFHKIMGTI